MRPACVGVALGALACVGSSSSTPPSKSDTRAASSKASESESEDESTDTGMGEAGSGEGSLVVERTTLRFDPDQDLALDLFVASVHATELPTVILAHGGLWQSGDKIALAPTCTAIVERSAGALACASINYRLSPALGGTCEGSGGDTYREQLRDFTAAFVFLRDQAERHGLDPARLFVGGHSAGAHLAWLLALRWPSLEPCAQAEDCPGPAGAIGFEGIYDIESWDAYDVGHWSGQFACATRRAFGASPSAIAPCIDAATSLACWQIGSPAHLVEHRSASKVALRPVDGLIVHSPADDWVDLREATHLGEALHAAFPTLEVRTSVDGGCASGSHIEVPEEASLADCIIDFVLEDKGLHG